MPPPGALPPNAGAFAAAPTASAPFNNISMEHVTWPRESRKLNNAALAAMIVSLASFVTCPLIGLVGAYLGFRAKREIQQTGEDGDGMATAGIVVGIISTGVAAVITLVVAIVLAFAAGAASVNN
jgi:ABC-type Fe3+ transport system permease subunit